MSFFLIFILAAFFSAIGVVPPGMLNITTANISIKKSLADAKNFVYGALIVVGVQSFVGFYFATFLQSHPQVTANLKLVGSVIFAVLTIFFLGKGIQIRLQVNNKLETTTEIGKVSSFVKGILLSVMNVFPVPYYAFLSLYFSAFIVSFFESINGLAFVSGSVLGCGTVYMLYAYLFKKWEDRVSFFTQNVNFIIALITGLVAIFTIVNL